MKHDKNIPVPAPAGLQWRIEGIDLMLVKSSNVDHDGNVFIEERGFFGGTRRKVVSRTHWTEEDSPIVASTIIWGGVRRASKQLLERHQHRQNRRSDRLAAQRFIANNPKGA